MAGESRRKKLRALLKNSGVAASGGSLAAFEAAFVHESAAREKLAERSNERLEFLGDAILGFIVARSLCERYPDAAPGELALRKAALVSDASLAASAERLGFDELLVLGAGLAKLPPARRRSALADAFEAFLAGLYGHSGMEPAAAFVLTQHVAEHERSGVDIADPKTVLQEWTQKRFARLPSYVERSEGPAHERTFYAEVTVERELAASGSGPSKKAAERDAAVHALARLVERYGEIATPRLSQAVPVKSTGRAAAAKSFASRASKRKRP
ncbi:MAG: ribonuclease III [Candidatus Eremiobacteraeota bacterium]|nr:ribonuclease III [Candidatus Eremiobacteraeota bacterium]